MEERTHTTRINEINEMTNQMSPLPMEVEEIKTDKYTQKCYYYNKGYCKKKQTCLFFHPTLDCTEKCSGKNDCKKRHRKKCRYGGRCYHDQQNVCEYSYDQPNRATESNELTKLKHDIENAYKDNSN